ncbi:transposable element Tcb2 transposase [Trichonephila clavipes]|nr:transposable element Tcb2 transposase [Trichonephila clavipes]
MSSYPQSNIDVQDGIQRRVPRQLGHSDCVVRKCPLHEDEAHDVINSPVIDKTTTSDESRLNLVSDGNRIRVWRTRGKRLDPVFALQRYTTPTAGVILWVAIAYNTRSPLEPFFNKTMLGLTRQDCLRNVTTPPWPDQSLDLSPI